MSEVKMIPNNHEFTEYFLSQEWFFLNGKKTEFNDILILPKEAFEVPPVIGHGYSEHHDTKSWHEKSESKIWWKELIKSVIPYRVVRQIGAYNAMKVNDYYDIYKAQSHKH